MLSDYQEIYEDSFLLRVDRDPELSVFILCGQKVSNALGIDPAGLTLEKALAKRIETKLCQACGRAVRESRPISSEGAYPTKDDGEIRYRSIFMPVRAGGQLDDGYVLGTFGQKTLRPNSAN